MIGHVFVNRIVFFNGSAWWQLRSCCVPPFPPALMPKPVENANPARTVTRRPRTSRNVAKSTPGMTKAREAAALAFVREHHPELEELLIQLGESQPKQYEAAIRDLFRTSEKLAAFHERDADRYAMELASWKLNSRVQLLSAQLLMSPADKALRAKLKQAMLDHAAVRRELLTLERERVTKRLEKLDAQIKNIDQGAERMVDRQIKNLLSGPEKSDVKTSSGK